MFFSMYRPLILHKQVALDITTIFRYICGGNGYWYASYAPINPPHPLQYLCAVLRFFFNKLDRVMDHPNAHSTPLVN